MIAALSFAASALVGAALVSAQAAINWQYVPSKCASDCSKTVETAYLCSNQYNSSTEIYACFCSGYPSDADGCSSCLGSNDASALGQLLTSSKTQCPQAQKMCAFECAFDQCASSDIACQCSATYLANIYDCASCNSANNNTDATLLTNFQALQESCQAQSYAGANQSFTTSPLASPTGQDAYVAPQLTATGGGFAASGDLTGSSAQAALTSGASGTPATSAAAAATTSMTSASAAGTTSGAAAGSTSASASAAASPSSGAAPLAAPAFGLLALGAVAALF